MTNDAHDVNPHLAQLILSLQMGGMQQLGKVASQITGKIERDLDMASVTIDMLAMIEEKTKGNLSRDEQNLLTNILSQLRMNFLDEKKKGDIPAEGEEASDDSGDGGD